MKTIRKFLVLAISAVLLTAALAFAGCGREVKPSSGNMQDNPLSGTMQIVITPDTDTAATVIDVDLKDFTDRDRVFDVVDALTDAGKLCYKGTKGIYGMYLTSIGIPQGEGDDARDSFILEEDSSAGRYLYIYTNVAADMKDGEYAYTVIYGGNTLAESLHGVSEMIIQDGAVIYFTYIFWG